MADVSDGAPDQQNPHPGWQSIASVVNLPGPFFENCLFMSSCSDFTSHIYVLKGEYLTVVDPGNDYTAFMELWGLGFTSEQIKKIVVTHSDPDHWMGGVDLLRSYPEIGKSGGLEFILHGAASPRLKETIKDFGSRVTEVGGGEILDLGGVDLEVIYTPGHTIDGICLYHALTRTIFTGDTVLPLAMAEPDPKVGGRLDHYLFGVKALLKRDIENVCPGHGPIVGPGGKRVVQDTYEALLMRIIGAQGPVPWIEGAKALAQKGLLEDALFCCDEDMAIHGDNLTALELKAICLSDMGRNEEAMAACDRILAQRSDHVFALIGKGCTLLELGRHAESLTYFDTVLQANPGMKEALMYKGMALYLCGRQEEAMNIEPFRMQFGRLRDGLRKTTRRAPE